VFKRAREDVSRRHCAVSQGRAEPDWGGPVLLNPSFPSAIGAADPDGYLGLIDEVALFPRPCRPTTRALWPRRPRRGARPDRRYWRSTSRRRRRTSASSDAQGVDRYVGPAGPLPRLPIGHYFVEVEGDRAEFAVLPDDYRGRDFIGTEADTGLFRTVTEKIDQIQPGWGRDMGRTYWESAEPRFGEWDWKSADRMASANKPGRKVYFERSSGRIGSRTGRVPMERIVSPNTRARRSRTSSLRRLSRAGSTAWSLWNEPLPSYWTWLHMDPVKYMASRPPDVHVLGPRLDRQLYRPVPDLVCSGQGGRPERQGLRSRHGQVLHPGGDVPQAEGSRPSSTSSTRSLGTTTAPGIIPRTRTSRSIPARERSSKASTTRSCRLAKIIGGKPIHINEYGLWGKGELGNNPLAVLGQIDSENQGQPAWIGGEAATGGSRALSSRAPRSRGDDPSSAYAGRQRSGRLGDSRARTEAQDLGLPLTAYWLNGAKLIAKRTPGERVSSMSGRARAASTSSSRGR